MRFLNTKTLELSPLHMLSQTPDYVIFSHRWCSEEVTFADINKDPISNIDSETRNKAGFAKIQGVCALALQDGYEWIWIDSCCIDKSSSAELQEAINSMWRYYAESNICYAYLADVPDAKAGWNQPFVKSDWFKRGWTLQELIAPKSVEFYARNWDPIGTKTERHKQIKEITSIEPAFLCHHTTLRDANDAQKMSWAAHRKVTREEDEAYCLFGLFDINMPLLYGEGREKAFFRLQTAIHSAHCDQSLFLFRYCDRMNCYPLLAESPTDFCEDPICGAHHAPRALPADVRYEDIRIFHSRKSFEHILGFVTSGWSEVSTVLSLIPYEDISREIVWLRELDPRHRIPTHLAVLNMTWSKYKEGVLCLLVDKVSDKGTCWRLDLFPVMLPNRHKVWFRLCSVRILVSPGAIFLFRSASEVPIKTMITVDSEESHVDYWRDTSTGSKITGNKFLERFISTETDKISCYISSSCFPLLLLAIDLVWIRKSWSITQVTAVDLATERSHWKSDPRSRFERPTVHVNGRTIFSSSGIYVDRCTVCVADSSGFSIALRRAPARAGYPDIDYKLSIRRAHLIEAHSIEMDLS